MGYTTSQASGRAAIALIAAGLLAAGCGSSSSSPAGGSAATSNPPAASGSTASTQAVLKTGSTSVGTVLMDSRGFTVYWFGKDTASTSACTGACTSEWPPVTGMPSAASGVTLSGKFGTISRGGGVLQATYNGHPLYTFAGDSGPGQASGNGINDFGATWHAIAIGSSGTTTTPTGGSTGGYGY